MAHEMTCDESSEILASYALGALPDEERDDLEAHLQGCPACRLVLEQDREVVEELPRGIRLVDPPPDDDERPSDLEIDAGSLVRAYYDPYDSWLGDSGTSLEHRGVTFQVARAAYDPVDEQYVFVGVASAVLDHARRGQRPPAHPVVETESSYVGSNGVAVFEAQGPAVRDILR